MARPNALVGEPALGPTPLPVLDELKSVVVGRNLWNVSFPQHNWLLDEDHRLDSACAA